MRFSTSAISVLFGLIAAPFYSLAFAPNAVKSTAFISQPILCGVVQEGTHTASCACSGCSSTSLKMSEEAVVEAEEVPAEVASLDGIQSDEEAHNAERPSRGSGIGKHKKAEKGSGTPLADLEVGATVEGKIKTTTSYGAFVDIGAATDALLHVSRLSDDFVSNVEDVVKAGDTVSVRIASVNIEKNQIAVSMRSEEAEANADAARASGGKRKSRPQRSSGDRSAQVATLKSLAEKGYDEEKFVEGEVVSMLDFGAFVRFSAAQLAEGVEGELDGLVHISSLCVGRASSVDSIVSVGDKVQIRVKNLDTEGNKVSLSMISKEDEQQAGGRRGGGEQQSRRRGRQMFSEAEMGAKDWKDSLEKFQGDQPAFANAAVVVDKRK